MREARTAPFDFFPGAVVNPYKLSEPAQMMQLYKLELKIAAGARFVITQMGFNLRKLVELKQYMAREGLGHVPVLANVYVPTATIGRMALSGDLAGCIVPGALVQRLAAEKKPERLERAALMLAAVRELGFAGAHIGGFRLTHADFLSILERAAAIGSGWRVRMAELVWETPGEFYLLPPGDDGLSDAAGEYQLAGVRRPPALKQRASRAAHRWIISRESPVGRFLAGRLERAAQGAAGSERWRHGFWYRLLAPSSLYRKSVLGCMSCGDCIQDHLDYAGCPIRMCYKQLRNGPCGGSRPDGSCEARPEQPCFWHVVYDGARSLGDDPRRFARTLIPPRNWRLDQTNALANHFAHIDNAAGRVQLEASPGPARQEHGTC
ncbi:MAG TPA: methylenetetrahydrofolate reductase C-terminal domain-containing protein, partial [Longimicrobiales bacterium]